MQISAANLILAAQQTKVAKPAGDLAAARTQATAAAKTARFSPPDFDAATDAKPVGKPQPPAAAERPARGYAALAAPGSQLDIRV